MGLPAARASGKVQRSHVLAAMEISPALVHGAVRVRPGLEHSRGRYRTLFLPLGRLANALCREHSIAA